MRMLGVEALQQHVQLPALTAAQRAEELLAGRGRIGGQRPHRSSARRGQADAAAAAVSGVNLADDQPALS